MIDQTIKAAVSAVIAPKPQSLVPGSEWLTDEMLIWANFYNALNRKRSRCRIRSATPKHQGTGAALIMQRVQFTR